MYHDVYEVNFLAKPSLRQKEQLLKLYHDQGWWPEKYDDPERISRILEGSHCFLVAETEGDIVGMGRALSDKTGDAYLHDILVNKKHRGKSLGEKIVKTLVQRLRADGITWIGLIAEQNSHGFYEKLGFNTMKKAAPMFIWEDLEDAKGCGDAL